MNVMLNRVERIDSMTNGSSKDLHSSNKDIEHGGEGVTTIGNVLMNNYASIPNK
jgi:hypothetical protein